MTTGVVLDIPVNVEQTGWYDMHSILSYKKGLYTSKITLSVDGKPVLVNNSETVNREDLSAGETYVSVDYPMYRFGTSVYLEAGEHLVSLNAIPREAYASESQFAADKNLYRVCFYADNITFTPAVNSAVANDNKVAVSAFTGEAVSGKAIIAAYEGDEMVGVSFADIADVTRISDTISCSRTPEYVKVMLWNNLTDVTPVLGAETITVD